MCLIYKFYHVYDIGENIVYIYSSVLSTVSGIHWESWNVYLRNKQGLLYLLCFYHLIKIAFPEITTNPVKSCRFSLLMISGIINYSPCILYIFSFAHYYSSLSLNFLVAVNHLKLSLLPSHCRYFIDSVFGFVLLFPYSILKITFSFQITSIW